MTISRKQSLKSLIQLVEEYEKNQIASILSNVFGYHLAQLGTFNFENFMENSPISHRFYVTKPGELSSKAKKQVVAQYDNLPFLQDSIDLFLLPHQLEKTENYAAILSEVWRVLIPQGQAVIIGINPYSLWGLYRAASNHSKTKFPWDRTFLKRGKLIKIFDELNFEIVTDKAFFYRPPLIDKKWLKRTRFLEVLGQILWPSMGGIYIYVIRKKVSSLTPIKPRWKLKNILNSRQVIQPTRLHHHDKNC